MAINSYHKFNEIETHLITWGDPFNCNGADVILCVTGNPGIPDFYEEFGSVLHERTKLPVCVVGMFYHCVYYKSVLYQLCLNVHSMYCL